MKDKLGAPKIVARSTFQVELDALRVREKAHPKEGDAIAAARRRLPMVEVDGATPLIGERARSRYWIPLRQEIWEDSPAGWPQRFEGKQANRTDCRPTAQWSRLKAGFSDDLGISMR